MLPQYSRLGPDNVFILHGINSGGQVYTKIISIVIFYIRKCNGLFMPVSLLQAYVNWETYMYVTLI